MAHPYEAETGGGTRIGVPSLLRQTRGCPKIIRAPDVRGRSRKKSRTSD
jgi:hypothetical protein